MRLHKNGNSIVCVEDWQQHASPKRKEQWKEGRSAYELAHAWCGSGNVEVPAELKRLLESRAETRGITFTDALPEHQIRFDEHRGEPRNADLALSGSNASGTVAITIEAKADETFGSTVSETLADSLERWIQNPNSGGIRRVEGLVRGLLPPRGDGVPHVGHLRYQLLTAVAGTLAYATSIGASLAVMVVHEFKTTETDDARHAENAADLERFLHRLTGSTVSDSNALVGPIRVPDAIRFNVPLLIGKVTTDRRKT